MKRLCALIACKDGSPERGRLGWLKTLLIAQALLYAGISVASARFSYDAPFASRPLLLVLALFSTCFALHLISLKAAIGVLDQPRVLRIVVLGAALFRGLLIFSEPIQEIDIYRYLWDGAVVATGVNPYQYAPVQVLEARGATGLPHGLSRLADACDRDPPLAELLTRVHYGELTTAYPPVSQLVFAVAHVGSERRAIRSRVLVLKALLLLFDFGTIGAIVRLLSMAGRHVGWSITYAWSPLVLKEFSNSGHLDVIAVCFAMAALACWTRSLLRPVNRSGWGLPATSGLLLGLAIGSKLFPVILVPLLVTVLARRVSWRSAAALGLATLGSALFFVSPMLLTLPINPWNSPAEGHADQSGLTAFLSRWEMNDLPFMLVLENLRPAQADVTGAPWFVVVPEAWRLSLVERSSIVSLGSGQEATFLLARAVTLVAFAGLACWLARWAQQGESTSRPLEAAFLTIAAFWALSPTMNPWYWTWAVPLLPFARNRGWLLVSGMVFAYYLRFWFRYYFAEESVLGSGYAGTQFFEFIVVPCEHGMWLGAVGACWLWRRRSSPPCDG